MNLISDELDATLMLVRAADPIAQAGAPPDTEAQLRVLLANLPTAEPRKMTRRRRPLALGAVGLAAAAATVAAVNLAPGGHGVSGSLSPSGGFVSQAQAAQIIARVRRTLTHYPPGEIVVTREVGSTTRGTRTILRWTYAQWLSTSFPYRDRFATTNTPGRSYEEGTTRQGVWQLYDPARNVIYQRTQNPGYELTRGPGARWWTVTLPKAYVYTPDTPVPATDRGNTTLRITGAQARALRRGTEEIMYTVNPTKTRAHEYWLDPRMRRAIDVTGGTSPPVPAADWVNGLTTRGTRVTLDGKRAIKISQGKHETMWFAATTLTPIKQVYRNRGETTTIRFTRYRVFKGAAASTKLLSVQRAHPTAKLVIGIGPLYDAEKRLGS